MELWLVIYKNAVVLRDDKFILGAWKDFAGFVEWLGPDEPFVVTIIIKAEEFDWEAYWEVEEAIDGSIGLE